jgi:hypothetical protein
MTDAVGEAVLQHARDVAARGDWEAAFELFTKADADGPRRSGRSTGPRRGRVRGGASRRKHRSVGARVRAVRGGRRHRCGSRGGGSRGDAPPVRFRPHAPVRGWLARAERHLEGRGETPASAWLAAVRAYERMLTGDLPNARQWARRAIELADRSPAAGRGRQFMGEQVTPSSDAAGRSETPHLAKQRCGVMLGIRQAMGP